MSPNVRVMLLALATIAGLIGMFVTSGWLDVGFFVLAAVPLTMGVIASLGHSRKP